MRTAWRPSASRLEPHLAAAHRTRPTYDPPGLSAADPAPPGFRVLDRTVQVGQGADAWRRVVDALLGWEVHRGAGLLPAVSAPRAVVGATVVNVAPFRPLAPLAPCRVVEVEDREPVAVLAYGSLPGHPLVGEERFEVALRPDGAVLWRLRSVSRPTGVTALAGPVARAVQRGIDRRFADAARRAAAG